MLARGQGLTSNVSPSNMSTGFFNAGIDKSSLSAFSEVDYFPIRYLSLNFFFINLPLNYVEFIKGNITFDYYYLMKWPRSYRASLLTSNKSSVQIMKMDYDGGLRIYGWEPGKGWENLYALAEWSNECRFPLRCGRYGVCNEGGNCTCPAAMDGVRYFTSGFVGCSQVLVEGTHDHYRLVNFGNLSYYSSFDKNQARPGVEDEVSCVEACEKNTSCRAAFFNFDNLYLKGYCFLAESVLTLMNTTESDNQYSSSYIKIQISSHKNSNTTSVGLNSPFLDLALLASVAVLLSMLMITIVVILIFQKKKTEEWSDHAFLKQVSTEIPIKSFSYHELYVATEKFSEKLGQGSFGTVFRGVLTDGTVVAVKRLETMRGTKEFLAEVESIGNIHHINLVRLIGLCANRKYRMLVYEYMSKGSLDKWIFCKPDAALDWNTRKKIVIDIAKGLAYLHEECSHRIAHLDVKPHNILLDDNFNAKLSDFGMSKMINRDESRVVTGIRGTLGYLAPEWEDLRITVKADVHSFGILLLEIITGKKIMDYSRPHSDVHLLSLLGKKAFENRLKDMVECQSEDMQHHVEEAIGMMRLGMWCSDGDYNRRPLMSMVVKILDSGINAAST
ncbi:Serine/threonine protein kinase [Trema orientale]|uniref:non-specific serine/threonine protein kinase n=1 Tax=Trema orientale TaxID=63057 RepID=A0A2P5FDH3_TREOI|nr:Serine/threonine protein kinase [Trema orientale]